MVKGMVNLNGKGIWHREMAKGIVKENGKGNGKGKEVRVHSSLQSVKK